MILFNSTIALSKSGVLPFVDVGKSNLKVAGILPSVYLVSNS